MRFHSIVLFSFVLLSVGSWVSAEENVSQAEAEITIVDSEGKVFYEHRVNGVLTEIKVVPSVGATYYLVPADGGGWIREDRSSVLVPKWVLFEW